MKNLQTSIVVEETWVEKHTDILNAQPTAINAKLLDVSTLINIKQQNHLTFLGSNILLFSCSF